jgi:phosphoribosylanthranilate isomerase
MSVEAKICGLSTAETVDAAVEGGARFIGFNFYPPSPRYVGSNDNLKALGGRVPKNVIRVGLFVDPDDALLNERLATGVIDLLQLHGKETPERVAAIKARTGKPVMKAFNVGAASDIERGIAAYATVADRLMFDAAAGTLPGGNAQVFDWTFLSGRKIPLPWLLAGGLTPDNVAEAVRVTGAPIVDVSSGVESSRGVKSVDLIRAFLDRVKAL